MSKHASTPVLTRTYYPTHLRTFRDCPLRYYEKYVACTRVEEPFSPALAKGDAAHKVLEHCGHQLQRKGTLPTNLRDQLAQRLPRPRYPSREAWEADLDETVAAVKRGLAYLDTIVLCTETTLSRLFGGDEDCPPFVLATKLDAVLRREDDGDVPVIEVVDYKTGRPSEPEPIDLVSARYVVKRLAAARFPGQRVRVVSTALYLADGAEPWSRELSLDECLETWNEIKGIVRDIEASTVWPAVPSSACEWCPFRARCPLFAPGPEPDADLW